MVALLMTANTSFAQHEPMRLMFYNTENLFDTIDNPLTSDEEFTPEGKNQYTSERYQTKLTNLSKVIDAAFEAENPDVLGLCEVENKAVVQDLISKVNGAERFQIVHHESNDQRGIDNALIYNSIRLHLIGEGVREIDLGKDERPTRPILWAHFKDIKSGNELIVCINHWPSRYGGEDESRWKRAKASEVLESLINELKWKYPKAQLVAMGDFNDHPDDESVKRLENCEKSSDACLVNMHKHLTSEGKGTHAYKDEWGVLDQMLVGQNVVGATTGFSAIDNSGETVSFDWMMYESKDKKLFPSRTYGGAHYYGGYSDHLPITLILE
ncbi:MAG: hypothetical protein R2813_09195 [Flavobacteriales bacterium]